MSKHTKLPLVSVVIPVYNASAYVASALVSILGQTYTNTEIIIVDDASTDNTWEILTRFAKQNKNIKLLRNKKTQGVSNTVERAIEQTQGDFLARMDADDIALPTRIEKQLDYLLSHPKTVAVGGQCVLINKNGSTIGKKTFPLDFSEIYKYIYRFVPVQQPTLMIAKKRLPKDFRFYTDGLNTAEEVELIFKLFLHGKVENLSDVVLLYRIHDKNTSFLDLKKTFLLTLLARIKAVFRYNYKPDAGGVFITFIQALLVFILPSKMILLLYKTFRQMSVQRIDFFSLKKLFYNPLALKQ